MYSWRSPLQRIDLTLPLAAWLFVGVFFVVGDVVTTAIGLHVLGLAEHNPVLSPLVARHGFGAVVVIKGLVVGGGYLGYRLLPGGHAIGIPLGFAVVGVGVTAWNLSVLGFALLI